MSTADERSALLLKRKKLNEALRRLRVEQAAKWKTSPMQVLQNATLADIVVSMPKTKSDLLRINGFSPKKTEQFGDVILQAVEAYRKEHAPQTIAPLEDSTTPSGGDENQAAATPPKDASSSLFDSRLCHADAEEIHLGPLLGAKFV